MEPIQKHLTAFKPEALKKQQRVEISMDRGLIFKHFGNFLAIYVDSIDEPAGRVVLRLEPVQD